MIIYNIFYLFFWNENFGANLLYYHENLGAMEQIIVVLKSVTPVAFLIENEWLVNLVLSL